MSRESKKQLHQLGRALLGRRRWRQLVLLGSVLAALLGLLWPWIEQPDTTEGCAVVSVYDGDTVTLRCHSQADQPERIKVRVWGIDAPEMDQRPWGGKARDRLRALAGSTVAVEEGEPGQLWPHRRAPLPTAG